MTTGLRRYEFSERLADILGASRRDLRLRVTLLITGGLFPPGPRGPGSPPATPDYAAELLIGVMAAPQQVQTVDAVRCYRDLQPTVMAAEAVTPGIFLGAARKRRIATERPEVLLLPRTLRFGQVLAQLLDQAGAAQTRAALTRELFGIWVSRGFPVAAVQLATWADGRRAIVSQRYELPEGARPPAWLDPDQGGAADPGLFHSVFLPVSKLIEIGTLIAPKEDLTEDPTAIRSSPVLGQTIAHLASLARDKRHKRPWEKFVAKAAPAQAKAEKVDARVSRLAEVTGFGSNPGNLRMMTYVPVGLPEGAPLVVALHGCTQTAASFDYGAGWSTMADRYGFAVLLPEQGRLNNPLRCFNWFKGEDIERNSGEALSVRQMVARMVADHGIDVGRIYVTGLSAGGAMTSVMLATYPEVFAGGAIVAGVPYRCANGLQDGFEVIFQGRSRSSREWGDLVRAASPHDGPWPKVSIWHGDADSTVKPMNAVEIIKQWTDVHGLSDEPLASTVDGQKHRVWRNPDGEVLVESFTIAGMAHGVAIDPTAEDGCGATAPFILDVGISSTHHIAAFWGLTDKRWERPAAAAAVSPIPVSDAASAATPAEEKIRVRVRAGSAPLPGSTMVPIEKVERRGGADAPFNRGARANDRTGARASESSKDRTRDGTRDRSHDRTGTIAGVDVPGIINASLQAAGLLKGGGAGAPGAAAAGIMRAIDIPSILARSFQAAGLMRDEKDVPGDAAGEGQAGFRDASRAGAAREGAKWDGEDWQRLTDDSQAPGEGSVLFGYASSGIGCDVGEKIRTISRPVTLGARPKLRYMRRLDLRAAVNILTSASFTVLVDGIAVDEVSVVGMDYAEADWTPRAGIDLARFAGRTATLTIEVTAKSNVCIEVFGKARLADIVVEDETGRQIL